MSDLFGKDETPFDLSDISLREAFQNHEMGGGRHTSMRGLTDKERAKNALSLPPAVGTRVQFKSNLGAVMSYPDPPADKMGGTVVLVRTGGGDTTHMDSMVFVQYDDGSFLPTMAEHLRAVTSSLKKARTVSMRVADLGDLTNFFSGSTRANELVHKSTKDLWAVRQDGEQYVIERLFQETGEPLKV